MEKGVSLTLDRLKEVTGNLQASVGAVVRLRSKAHGGTVASTSPGLLVICARGVPGKTDENLCEGKMAVSHLFLNCVNGYPGWSYRSIAAIIILILLNQQTGNLIVDLLVVLLGGNEVGIGLEGAKVV